MSAVTLGKSEHLSIAGAKVPHLRGGFVRETSSI
jgi:hypothetical protein